MRRDNHIGHRNQPHQHIVFNNAVRAILVEQVALFLVNIQARSADPTAFKSVNKRFCVDQRTSGGVDDHDAWLHSSNSGSVNHMLCLSSQRAVERNHIRLRQQFQQRHIG